MLTENQLMRQLAIIPMEALNRDITVIGAGAIGSFTVLALAKMGFTKLTVYDFDYVSDENMNCQWYRTGDIGLRKVDALKSLIKDFTGTEITIHPDRYDGSQPLNSIVISAVDSMAVRQLIWEKVKLDIGVRWLIDPRMAAEYALCFVMGPHDYKDRESYQTTLYSDDTALNEPCTAKATMYTATMIAGYVAKMVKDIVTDGKYARVTHWNIGTNHHAAWAK